MTRQKPSLRAPPPADELGLFPCFRLDGTRALWRVVRDGVGPWWFSSSLEGRFDLPAPDGTCYVASDDVGALLELLGPDLLPGGSAPASLLAGRHLRRLHVPEALTLADSLAERATRWVTAELATITPYALPQAWARAFHAAGLSGVRYAVRHSASPKRHSCALFSRAGERRSWRRGRRIQIKSDHRARLRRACGIEIFDLPREDELVFAP